jgi:thimet oligopeptidase
MSTSSIITADAAGLAAAGLAAIGRSRELLDIVRAGGPALAVLDAYDEALASLSDVYGCLDVIAKAHPEAANRQAAEATQQDVSKELTDISLDRTIYDALSALDLTAQDAPTQHFVARTLREFRRAGVDRDDATRERVRELQNELVAIGQDFDRNIREDTRTIRVSPTALRGLPDDYVRAHQPGDDGLVAITTDYPDLVPFMQYSTDAAAREQLWTVRWQRADPANIDVLHDLLAKRHELATILGYPTWAAYITEDKMIGSADAAGDFIARITDAAAARSARDYARLLTRKRADDPAATAVMQWDTNYLQDRVQAEEFAFDSQAMRPYFEYNRVKGGLMGVVEQLFGVRFAAVPEAPVWHPEVECFDVMQGDDRLGRIYLDMHPRENKFNHAAMFAMAGGKAGERLPECALLCNLPRPGVEPALLQHTDVTTFFHEFGHLIHHVFAGCQRWAGLGGVSTEWDFVEAPSQLLEEWTQDAKTLAGFAVHHETGEVLPAEMVARLRAANEFGKGLWVQTQMSYAALSLALYRADPDTLDFDAVERRATEEHTPYPHIPGTHLRLSFGHLDGYSAMYYTYMWSLVIAKDLFTGFDKAALLDPGPAGRYRESVLAAGSSAPAADLVRSFLGRDSGFDAYREWLDQG